jgi:hypothetical protein
MDDGESKRGAKNLVLKSEKKERRKEKGRKFILNKF